MNPEQLQNLINSTSTFGLLLAIFGMLYYLAVKKHKKVIKNK